MDGKTSAPNLWLMVLHIGWEHKIPWVKAQKLCQRLVGRLV
jgi:hypothetical protein